MAESENSRFASVAETNIEELLENAVPVAMTKATEFGMNLFDGKLTFNFIFNIKFTKQNKAKQFIYKRVGNYWHNQKSKYQNKSNKNLPFSEWLASPFGSKFTTPITEMSKAELNQCLKMFYVSARKKDGGYYKKASIKSIRAAIDRFLRGAPHNKPLSIINDPQFTESNSVLNAFV